MMVDREPTDTRRDLYDDDVVTITIWYLIFQSYWHYSCTKGFSCH